jgi:hypothetical protein
MAHRSYVSSLGARRPARHVGVDHAQDLLRGLVAARKLETPSDPAVSGSPASAAAGSHSSASASRPDARYSSAILVSALGSPRLIEISRRRLIDVRGLDGGLGEREGGARLAGRQRA